MQISRIQNLCILVLSVRQRCKLLAVRTESKWSCWERKGEGFRTGTLWSRSSAVNSARPAATTRSVKICWSRRRQECLSAGGRADGNSRTFLCFRLGKEWVIPALWASDSTGEHRVCLCEFQRAVVHFHADLCHCSAVQMCCNSVLLFMAGFYTFFQHKYQTLRWLLLLSWVKWRERPRRILLQLWQILIIRLKSPK